MELLASNKLEDPVLKELGNFRNCQLLEKTELFEFSRAKSFVS